MKLDKEVLVIGGVKTVPKYEDNSDTFHSDSNRTSSLRMCTVVIYLNLLVLIVCALLLGFWTRQDTWELENNIIQLKDEIRQLQLHMARLSKAEDDLVRVRRDIEAVSGVPVFENSYKESVDGSPDYGVTQSEGLRIYEGWMTDRHPTAYTQVGEDTPVILPHHRKSGSWVINPNSHSNTGAKFDDKLTYNYKTLGKNKPRSRMQNRKSRVKVTGDSISDTSSKQRVTVPAVTPGNTQVVTDTSLYKSSVDAPEEQRVRVPEVIVGMEALIDNTTHMEINTRKHRHRERGRGETQSGFTGTQLHASLSSDDGTWNGNEVFKHWTSDEWVTKLHFDNDFPIRDGVITIRKPGIYLLYAQVHYNNFHETNGFDIYVNERPTLRCTTITSGATLKQLKTSSCFTQTVQQLQLGDQLYIRDIGNNRITLLRPGYTFMGLIRLMAQEPTHKM